MSNVINNTLVLLQDLYRKTCEDMSLQLHELISFDRKQMNAFADDFADQEVPILGYRFVQSGNYDIQVHGKAYLEYDRTELLFLYFADQDETPESLRTIIRQAHGVALEFLKRLIRREQFAEFAGNQGLQVQFDEVAYLFDANLAGVVCRFDLKLDPNDETPSC